MLGFISFITFICEYRSFKTFEELTADYESGELHPADLKPALAKSLNKILEVIYVLEFMNIIFVVFSKLLIIVTIDRKSTRLNSSHSGESRMPSSA